jgi:hypothetical protein
MSTGYGMPCYKILEALVDALMPLANASKGDVVPAHDPAEALDLLGNSPARWRVVVGVDDEDNAEGERRNTGETGTSETQFFTIVQAGVGLAAKPGKQIYKSRADGEPSLLELAEGVRAWMRGLRFDHPQVDCQAGFVWQKTTWVKAQQEGKPVQFGRQHVFTLVHQISNPAQLDAVPLSYS